MLFKYFGSGCLAGFALILLSPQSEATTGDEGWRNLTGVAPSIELQSTVDQCVNARGQSAIDACTQIVQLPLPASSIGWAFFDRGLAYFDQKDFAHAVADFDEGIKGEPNDDRAYYFLGKSKYLSGDLVGAISDLNRAISIAGNKPDYLLLRGHVFAAAKLDDLGIKDYSTIIAQGTGDHNAYRERGIAFYMKGDYAAAAADLEKAIELDAGDAKALEFRGNIYTRLTQYDLALDEYNRAIKAGDGLTYPYLQRAIAERHLKQFEPAIADLNVFVAAHSDDPEAFVERSFTFRAAGHPELALNDVNTALKMAPNDPAALTERGMVFSKLGRDDEALQDLNKSIAIKPDSIAFQDRASLRWKTKQYDVAIDDYNAALNLSPHDAVAFNNRCRVRALENADLKLALDDCNASLTIRPNNSSTLESRSFVDFRLKQFQQTVADSTAALAIDPQSADALYIRGLAKYEIGDTSYGADISSALAIKPDIEREYENYGVPTPKGRR